MNVPDHPGILVALIVLAIATSVYPVSTEPPTASPASAPALAHGWINDDGLIAAVAPLSLEQQAWATSGGRTRTPTQNELDEYAALLSESTLKNIAELGINFVIVPYGGYQPDDRERDERARIRAYASVCRKLGVRVGLIIPVGSLDRDGWEQEPTAVESLLRSLSGGAFTAPAQQRLLSARLHPWERERARRLLTEAIESVRPDAVFFQDVLMAVGHEPAAAAAFRAFLKERAKSNPDAAKRWGDIDLEKARPPTTAGDPPWLTESWNEFRVASLAGAIGELADLARTLQPGILVGIKDQGIERQFAEIEGVAIDPLSLWPRVDLVWSRVRCGLAGQDAISHQIAPMLAVRDAGAHLMVEVSRPIEAALSLAFAEGNAGVIAFMHHGNVCGQPGVATPIWQEVADFARFAREQRLLFADMEPVADVTLCRLATSELHGTPAARVALTQTEGALVAHRIPFRVAIGVAGLSRDARPDRTLIVAGAERMTDADVETLKDYVHRGGGLILVGECGTQDEFGRRRERTLSQTLAAAAPTTQPAASRPAPAGERNWEFGAGRVCTLRQPGPPAHFWLTKRPRAAGAREAPLNADSLMRALAWAGRRPPTLSMDVPQCIAVALTASATKDRYVIQRVNLAERAAPEEGRVALRLPEGRRVAEVLRYHAANQPAEAVSFKQTETVVEFLAPVPALYDALFVRTEPATTRPTSQPAAP